MDLTFGSCLCRGSKIRAASTPKRPDSIPTFEGSGVTVIGDDYWLTGGEHFADAVHMNPTGAAAYTGELGRSCGLGFSRPTAPSRR